MWKMFRKNEYISIPFNPIGNRPANIAPDNNDTLTKKLIEKYKSSPVSNVSVCMKISLSNEIDSLIELIFSSLYPGLYGESDNWEDITSSTTRILKQLQDRITRCVHCALMVYKNNDCCSRSEFNCEHCKSISIQFLNTLPDIHTSLQGDIVAAFEGDPAATSYEEIVLSYPGIYAISVYRVAHELYKLKVPLLPRLMTERSHSKTGIDIHPGAKIGKSFFIDHGTGVVIGETALIGDNVRLYQGVTLGALSFPKDASGKLIRGEKRHPTVEDNVTIYANATVLGGETIIEENCVVGGSVFVFESIPTGSTIKMEKPKHRITVKSSQ